MGLKGFGRRHRKLWDKAHPEYNNESPEYRESMYYGSIITARGYNEREDYNDFFNSLMSASGNPAKQNEISKDYLNGIIKEERKANSKGIIQNFVDRRYARYEKFADEFDDIQSVYGNNADYNEINNVGDALQLLSTPTARESRQNYQETLLFGDVGLAPELSDLKIEKATSAEDAAAEEEILKNLPTNYDGSQRNITREDVNKIKGIKEKAEEATMVYKNPDLRRKYLNLDNFSNGEDYNSWEDIANGYQGVLNKYKQEGKSDYEAQKLADEYLNRRLQNIVHDKQPWWLQMRNGTEQMFDTAIATAIEFAGLGRGIHEAVWGTWKRAEGETWFEYLMDAMNNNPWSVAANNLSEYGTLNSESAKMLEEQGGFRKNPIVASWEADNMSLQNVFDKSFIPNAVGQQGFTIALALTSMGGSKIVEGATHLAKARKISKLNKAIADTDKFLEAAAQASKIYDTLGAVGSAGVVFVSGIPEGHQNGYGTKKRILQEGKVFLDDIKQNDIFEAFEQSLFNTLSEDELNDLEEEDFYKLLDEFTNTYGDAILDQNSDKYQDIEDKIELDAIRAATINTVATNIINGSLNATLALPIQAPAVRNRLKNSKVGRFLSGDSNKLVAERLASGEISVTPKATYNKIKRVLNNPVVKAAGRPLGEFTEEYLQTISEEGSVGYARNDIANYVRDTYDFSDSNYEDFEGNMSNLAAAWKGVVKGATSTEAFKAGIYGAFGSLLGTPQFSGANYRNPVTGKISLKRREGETTGEYLSRITPWSGVISDYKMHKAEAEQAKADAKEVEDFLNRPENAEIADYLLGVVNFEQHLSDAIGSDDEFRARNETVSKIVKQMSLLSRIEGSPVAKAWNSRFDAVANMERESDIAKEAIEEYKKHNDYTGLSDDDIFNQVKKNAENIVNIKNKTQEYLSRADDIFPNALPASKEAFAYAMIALEDQQERRDAIVEELNKAKIDTRGAAVSNFTDAEKSAIIYFGSKDKASKGIKKLQEDKAALNSEIKKLSKNTDKTSQNAIANKKQEIRRIDTLLDRFKDVDVKELSQKKGTVLTQSDIMSLSVEQRAEMFNPGKIERYSEEQKKIIDDVLAQGTSVDQNYRQKTIDLARLETSIDGLQKGIYDMVTDATKMDSFVVQQRFNRALGFYSLEGEALSKIEDYDTFVAMANKAFNTNDAVRTAVLRQVLEAKNTDNWKKYKDTREYASEILNFAKNNTREVETFGIRSDNQNLQTFAAAVKFLIDEGVDVKDETAVKEALESVDEDGTYRVQKYIDTYNESMPSYRKILFKDVDSIFNDFMYYTHNLEAFNKVKAKTEEPQVPLSNPKPVSATSKGTKKEGDAAITSERVEETGSSNADRDKNFVNSEVKRTIEDLKTAILGGNLSEEEVKEFGEFIDEVPEDSNLLGFKDAVFKRYSKGPKKNKAVRKIISNYFREKSPSKEQQKAYQSKYGENSDASSIKVFGVDSFESAGYEDVKRIYDTYGINQYVSSSDALAGKNVVFAIEPELSKEGKYKKKRYDGSVEEIAFNPDNVPIMAMVESADGPVDIDGKKYQPIGILPRAGDYSTRGSSKTSIIRSYVSQEDIDSKRDNQQYSLIMSPKTRDKEAKPVSTTLQIISDGSYVTGQPRDFIDFLSEQLGTTDENALLSNFTNHIKVRSEKSGATTKKSLVYVPDGMEEGITLIRKPVLDTQKNGRSFSQVLADGTKEDIEGFNYFTVGLASKLARISTADSKSKFYQSIKNGNLETAASELKKAVSDFLYITDDSVGFKISKVTNKKTKEVSYNFYITKNGSPVSNTPFISDFKLLEGSSVSPFTTDNFAKLVKALVDTKVPLQWQVNYAWIENSQHRNQYIRGIFESGIYDTKVTTMYPTGTSLALNGSTLNKNFGEGTVLRRRSAKVQTAVNSENGNTSGINRRKGRVAPSSKEASISKANLDKFKQTSKELKREGDDYYIDKQGRAKARVTSVVREVKEGSSSIETAPQTLGNMADRLAKALFASRDGSVDKSQYKSLGLTELVQEALREVKAKFETYDGQSWEFLDPGEDGEFKVSGEVVVNLKNGDFRVLPITGAMDICMINSTGDEMLIIDTKTFNSDRLNPESLATYQKQLSLYAGFIEKNFGIKTRIAILGLPLYYENDDYYANSDGNLVYQKNDEVAIATMREPQIMHLNKLDLESLSFDFDMMPERTRLQIEEVLNKMGASIDVDNPISRINTEEYTGKESKVGQEEKQQKQDKPLSRNSEVHDYIDKLLDVESEEFREYYNSLAEFLESLGAETPSEDIVRDQLERDKDELSKKETVEECKNSLLCSFGL